ncbi:hypothetical protein ABE096_06815 [Robertmurraya massiliosenegalensis]|uniref:hypothetical protein n=1 Tax=Robertmurraya massiliosenegalensis TaxID=1287657 RepID=UPI003D2CE79C
MVLAFERYKLNARWSDRFGIAGVFGIIGKVFVFIAGLFRFIAGLLAMIAGV